VRFKFGPLEMHFAARPEVVQHVLQDNAKNYTKQTIGYTKVKLALGDGLLTSEGDFWRRQRRIVQPAFHKDSLRSFASTMVASTAAMLERWMGPAARGEPVEVGSEMMRLTLDIVCRTMFSLDMSEQATRLGELMTRALAYVNSRTMSLTAQFDFPEKLPTAKARRFRAAIREGDELVARVIEQRKSSGNDPGDLLSMLMNLRDAETGESMTGRQLRDEIITIFAAGHETTANLLTWTCWLIGRHVDVADRLHAEVDRVLEGKDPSLEMLPRLETTTLVLKEAMRLYPPAWALSRRAIAPDRLGGFDIPSGSVVLVSPFVTHRHPDVWPDPERFDPDRFLPSRLQGMPKYAYLPFGGGPRQCLGNHFAMMEAQIALAMVAQRFTLVAKDESVEVEPLVTLRPKHAVSVVLHRR